MKHFSIARGYAGLQAFIPAIRSKSDNHPNMQEVTTVAPVKMSKAGVDSGRVRLLAKRNIRFARRLQRQV